MYSTIKYSLLTVIFVLILPRTLSAQESLTLYNGQEEYLLGLHVAYLEDPTGQLTIEQVTATELKDQFQPSDQSVLNFRLTNSAYWLRVQIQNQSAQSDDWLLEFGFTGLDYVELYRAPLNTNPPVYQLVEQTGVALPFSVRSIPHHALVVPLAGLDAPSETIYIRVRTLKPMILPLTIWSRSAFTTATYHNQLLLGLFYGLILVMACYNLFLFLLLREKNYLYYVLQIVGFALFYATLDGLAAQYLWPEMPWWNLRLPFFISTFIFSLLRFSRFFLMTAQYHPRLHHLLTYVTWYSGTITVSFLFIYHFFNMALVILSAVIAMTLVFIAGFLSWRRGYRPAQYYIMAVCLPMMGISTTIMARAGLIPFTPITANSDRFGVMLMTVLFSIALADQINIIKQEKAAALEQVQLMNEQLELRVNERTVDLSKTNYNLQRLNERLQDQLIFARKIQEGLLLPPMPNWSNLETVCFTTPAREIGGDFYSYNKFVSPKQFRASAQRYAVAVGDVSGKGVSAALLMAACLSQLEAMFAHDYTPTERLVQLDEAILPYTKPRRQNCALCYTEFKVASDRYSTEVSIVNAGCIPPYIKRKNGSVEHPEIGGFALGQGLGAEFNYQQLTVDLQAGDMVILTSDGVVEANNDAEEMLGFERLEQILRQSPSDEQLTYMAKLSDLSGAEAMLEYLKQELFAFTGNAEQHDDMTIVVVRV
ncbi:7TM diverse intracellular signaling domain-containing protein [Anaerolineales bacterium HSG6]|nr:7TM diverse intracellular signaling domain-containing protein [Anaerolineales bacterium HSG6]